MKRKITFILAMWLAMGCYAIDYPQMSSAPSAAFNSTSPFAAGGSVYSNQRQSLSGQSTRSVGSMSTISSSNFAELNSEGGACYQPSATHPAMRRVTRPDGDDDDDLAIGEINEHSPVGNTPFLWMTVLLVGYALVQRHKKSHLSTKKSRP